MEGYPGVNGLYLNNSGCDILYDVLDPISFNTNQIGSSYTKF